MNRPVADASAAFVAGAQSPGGCAATPFVKGAGGARRAGGLTTERMLHPMT